MTRYVSSRALTGVSREDLVFTTPPQSWNRLTSPKGSVATHRFVSRAERVSGRESPVPLDRVAVDRGRIVREGGRSVLLFPRRGEVSFRSDGVSGRYQTLTVETKGNLGEGQAPVVEVRVDDQAVGWFEVGKDWQTRSFPLPLPKPAAKVTLASVADARYDLEPRRLRAGRHRLRLVFPNDAFTATEDRNLTIRQITFRRADTTKP
ncbi:MAG: carbohydrate-binding domain-containing protein [Fimbriimonas sp.]